MPSHHLQNRAASTGTDRNGPIPRAMITSQGYGLIAELIAAALLLITLSGFAVQRSQSWLAGVAIAFVALIAAVTIVIQSST